MSTFQQICPAVHEILANKDFTVTDDLISQLFVALVYSTNMQIALIWDFTAQSILWKSVHWYKLNKVCNTIFYTNYSLFEPLVMFLVLLIGENKMKFNIYDSDK